MTSLSHKKRPITQPNTDQANRPSVLAGRVWLREKLVVALCAIVVSVCGVAHGESPLDNRTTKSSAEERWEALRAAYLSHHRLAKQNTAESQVTETNTAPTPPPQFEWTATDAVSPSLSIEAVSNPIHAVPPIHALPTSSPLIPVAPAVQSRALSPVESSASIVAPTTVAPAPIAPIEQQPAPVLMPTIETQPADEVMLPRQPVMSTNDSDHTVQRINEVPEPSVLESVEHKATAEETPANPFADFGLFAELTVDDVENDPLGQPRGADLTERLKFRPLSAIVPSADYTADEDGCQFLCPTPENCPDGADLRCPVDVALPEQGSLDRFHPETMYHWAASNVAYNPLYFEDVRLERYGQHICEPLQSVKSVGLFAAQFASLPYQLALDPPHECVSPLGFYRPGEAAPCLKRAIPWNGKAVAASAGAYTGLIFLVP